MKFGKRYTTQELFVEVVKAWYRRRQIEELTGNQIASITLQSGTSGNALLVSTMMNEYGEYFYPPGKWGYKWRIRWDTIERDYPHLVGKPKKAAGPSPLAPSRAVDPIAEMCRALQDEKREVYRRNQERPVLAEELTLHSMSADGTVLYRAVALLEEGEGFPIPEGVRVKLRWERMYSAYPYDGTLLSYDPETSSVIFEVPKMLPSILLRAPHFSIEAGIEELINNLSNSVVSLRAHPDALCWRLFEGPLIPKPLPWSEPLKLQHLSPSQAQAVETSLKQDITFLWGPPGTGKTYTLGKMIATLALAGERVIATATANVAVDQLAKSVVEALRQAGKPGRDLLNKGFVLRFGYPRLTEVLAEERLFPARAEIQQLRKELHDARERHSKLQNGDADARAQSQKLINDLQTALRQKTKESIERARIVLTTATQACLEPTIAESPFSTTIVDEASMMSIPYVFAMGGLAKDRFVIAGDFQQLSPIAVSRTPAANNWLLQDAFSLVGISQDNNHPALVMLTEQRRMHPSICALINEPFYRGKLTTNVDLAKLQGTDMAPVRDEPVTLISLASMGGYAASSTGRGSRNNPEAAQFVAQLIMYHLRSHEELKVGVITPYRAQVALIREKVRTMTFTEDDRKRLVIGTVHAFQGSENDVIIWDLVDDRHSRIGKLYHGDTGNQLANVAISRAKGKLVLVGDRDAFFLAKGCELVKKFRPILARNFPKDSGRVTDWKDLDVEMSMAELFRKFGSSGARP